MKLKAKPLTRQTMEILSILKDARGPVTGSVLAGGSGLASGTLYPILIRLEKTGWISSGWEDANAEKPRRRAYRITALGVKHAQQEAQAWKGLVENFV